MDLSKFFDKEVLVDVLDEAKNKNINNKEYKLLYNLNKTRKIRVITAASESEEKEIDEGLGQGALDSGILSSCSVDGGLTTFFGRSPREIQPMAYQDDIMRSSKNLEDTRA